MESIEFVDAYYVRMAGNVFGPYSNAQMRRFIQTGKINRASEVSVTGENWQCASNFSRLFTDIPIVTPTTEPDFANPYVTPAMAEQQFHVAGSRPLTLWGCYWNGWYRSLSISGRATRTEYIMFTICNFFLYVLAMAIMGYYSESLFLSDLSFDTGFQILLLVCKVLLGTAWLTLNIRRLHDMGFSGIWLLLLVWLNWISVLILTTKEGTKGNNRFGPDPRFK